jgi:hypothetical protein
MTPLFVAYYTLDTPYADEAAGLIETLEAFALEHDVRGIPNRGSWQANTSAKAAFIAQMLREREGRPLVYVDVDARIRAEPVLFERLRHVDFAAHWMRGHELLSGTLYFGPGPAAHRLVAEWEKECAAFPTTFDQLCLQRVVESGRIAELCLRQLPAPYTLIFDFMADLGPPVIEHLQASRRLKNGVAIRSSHARDDIPRSQ